MFPNQKKTAVFSLSILITSFCLPISAQQIRRDLRPLSNQTINNSSSVSNISQQFPYTLNSGDRIFLDVFNVPEYSKEYTVLVDGTLNLPLVDRISVANLTLEEAENIIRQEYLNQGFLRNPIISINLTQARPISVAIVGEVRTPGSYFVPFEGANAALKQSGKFPSLIDALQLANGINASANTRQIRVVRNYKGREYLIAVNLWQFLDQGDSKQNVLLRDGDRIIVPAVETIDSREVLRIATSNFSANLNIPITVTIVGEVNRPGPYTLSGNDVRSNNIDDQLQFQNNNVISNQESLAGIPTTTRAIKTAGGLTAKADLRNIEVRRTLPSGKEQTIQVNLWQLLQTGEFLEDALLQNGDRIFVPTAESMSEDEIRQVATASFSPNSINVSVIGEVKQPGVKQLSPDVSLQQAILEAGGFDEVRAEKSIAKLIRLNPNGTVSEKIVEVDFDAPLNEETNPILLNNDIVLIERSDLAVASDVVSSVLAPIAPIVNLFSGFSLIFDRLGILDD